MDFCDADGGPQIVEGTQWSISFDPVGGGIRQNAEKATQTFDAFLLNSGEFSATTGL